MVAQVAPVDSRRLAVVLLCTLSAFFLTSCATNSRGIKLSEAAEQAKKKPEEQKTLQEPDTSEPLEPFEPDPVLSSLTTAEDDSLELAELERSDRDAEPPLEEGAPALSHGGLIVGVGTLTGDSFDGFGLFGFQFGGLDVDGTQLDATVLFIPTNLIPESDLVGALKDEFEVAIGVSGRRYLTPSHTFMGLYGMLGLRFGALNWHYVNPIAVETDEGTDIIHSDWVGYLAPYAGVGVSLAQTSRFRFGVNASVGVKLYHWNTMRGFENDLFGTGAFFQIMVPVSIGRF